MNGHKSEYELERDQRIARNKRKMEEMGILTAKAEWESLVAASQPAPVRKVRKARAILLDQEVRRSARERATVNYCEEPRQPAERMPRGPRNPRLDLSTFDAAQFPSPKVRSTFDSGKGVRVQGGRVYDSRLGVTCHWCRQKTVESKVTCTASDCGRGRRLPISFCRKCLNNRHGEDVRAADASKMWVCPCCRGSCGAGCPGCCNCGPCRQKAGLPPTHQLSREARTAGFTSVHDFLVHQATGESAAAIAARKLAADWGRWLVVTMAGESADADAAEETGGKEEEPATGTALGPISARTSYNYRSESGVRQPDPYAEPKKMSAPAATIDDQFAAVKAHVQPLGKGEVDKDRIARRAARKARAMTAVGLMAPIAT